MAFLFRGSSKPRFLDGANIETWTIQARAKMFLAKNNSFETVFLFFRALTRRTAALGAMERYKYNFKKIAKTKRFHTLFFVCSELESHYFFRSIKENAKYYFPYFIY